jgi:hypothetical protein
MGAFEITLLEKRGGPLSKRIKLGDDGQLHCDSSHCSMGKGNASRFRFDTAAELGGRIGGALPNQAFALGTMVEGVADTARIVTKAELQAKSNGVARANLITRSREHLEFRRGPGWVLFDVDLKGMPETVRTRVEAAGGVWAALVSVVPELASTMRVMRLSTSAGLFCEVPELVRFPHSGGRHIFIAVQDVSDSKRFLEVMHQRCWNAGFGWLILNAAGQILERSLIDRTVGSPERLVLEAPPELVPPLQQDVGARKPIVVEGGLFNTRFSCPELSLAKSRQLEIQIAAARRHLRPMADQGYAEYVARKTVAEGVSKREIARRCEGVLRPGMVLEFDAPSLAGKTVGDVLADPEQFDGATLADPIEGVGYGRGKARV